jgi:hypothetical protein
MANALIIKNMWNVISRHHRHRPNKKSPDPLIETIQEKRLSNVDEDDAGIILDLSPKKTKEQGKDEELQQLMLAPEIVVEPPSGSSSPTKDSPV